MPDPIPLADDTFECAVCGKKFVPRGGEMTCVACTDRVRTRTAVASAGHQGGPKGHGDATLMDDSVAHAAGVVTHALFLVGLAIVAAAAVVIHWWFGAFGEWAAAAAWCAFVVASIVMVSPTMSPPKRHARAPRGIALLGALGALIVALALAAHPVLSPNLPGRAALDVIAILGALTFLIGASLRLTEVAAWTGHDPTEGGLFSQAGPTLLAVFIVCSAYLMTHFFLRPLDACDAFAAAIAAWLAWRSIAIAWHGVEAGASRASADARAKRRLLGRTHCLTCGYEMRGLEMGARCPECGKPRSA